VRDGELVVGEVVIVGDETFFVISATKRRSFDVVRRHVNKLYSQQALTEIRVRTDCRILSSFLCFALLLLSPTGSHSANEFTF